MKKILALMVALCAVFAVGCSSEEKAPEKDNKSAETQNAESNPVEANADEEDEAPVGNLIENTSENTEKKSEEEQISLETNKKSEKKDMLSAMSKDEKVELNKFLSNFAEALCDVSVNYDADSKISFAFHHAFINEPTDSVVYVGDMMGIKAEMVDAILNRFFGESVPHESTDGGYWTYEDGCFLIPAASGESYAYFAIATGMTDNGDGTYTVEFNEYFDSEAWEYPVSEWYSLDEETATDEYELVVRHRATVRPKTVNNEETYEMVEFMC